MFCLESFMLVLQIMSCVCFKIAYYDFIFTHFGLFNVPKGGEKNWYFLEIKILCFQCFKIKHKLKKKRGERDE